MHVESAVAAHGEARGCLEGDSDIVAAFMGHGVLLERAPLPALRPRMLLQPRLRRRNLSLKFQCGTLPVRTRHAGRG
ncbi:hypothetical protein AVXHC19_22270 [Acidovorax sacchari]